MNAVEATVRAYGSGKVELEKPADRTSKDQLRYAPGFVQEPPRVDNAAHPYTALSVGLYLGWVEDDNRDTHRKRASERVRVALSALELIERGVLKRAQPDKHRKHAHMMAEAVWQCDTVVNDWLTCPTMQVRPCIVSQATVPRNTPTAPSTCQHQRVEPVLRVHVPRRHRLQPGQPQPPEVRQLQGGRGEDVPAVLSEHRGWCPQLAVYVHRPQARHRVVAQDLLGGDHHAAGGYRRSAC